MLQLDCGDISEKFHVIYIKRVTSLRFRSSDDRALSALYYWAERADPH